jgi:hypothetical protein
VRLQGGNSNGRLTSFGKAATITIRRRGKCSERGKKVLRLEEHSETPQRECRKSYWADTIAELFEKSLFPRRRLRSAP